MLVVRNIFPGESSPLWGMLESRIQQRIDERKAEGGPKVNLFANLSQRIAAAPAKPGPVDNRPVEQPPSETQDTEE